VSTTSTACTSSSVLWLAVSASTRSSVPVVLATAAKMPIAMSSAMPAKIGNRISSRSFMRTRQLIFMRSKVWPIVPRNPMAPV